MDFSADVVGMTVSFGCVGEFIPVEVSVLVSFDPRDAGREGEVALQFLYALDDVVIGFEVVTNGGFSIEMPVDVGGDTLVVEVEAEVDVVRHWSDWLWALRHDGADKEH